MTEKEEAIHEWIKQDFKEQAEIATDRHNYYLGELMKLPSERINPSSHKEVVKNGISRTFTLTNVIAIICFTFASGFIIGWVANWVVQHWNVLRPW